MKTDVCPDPPTDPGLDQVLADYLQLTAVKRPDRDQLIATNPEHSTALREFIEDLDWMRRVAGPAPARTFEAGSSPLDDGEATATDSTRDTTSSPIVAGRPRGLGPFGDYELLEEIARGAMGVVYKARQRSLNRIVALKMILSGHLAAEEDVQRFQGEARAAAILRHPGIVPVYEVGNLAGHHYYTMEFVEGVSLNVLIRDDALPIPREAAELVRRVADAIHYAHQQGVIHRDLKPANILLERSDRDDAMRFALAGDEGRFQPRITDFGLAKKIDTDVDLTGTGQVLGTPTYMAPEQAAGKGDQVGPASDGYALGALLYCLLTGRPPFRSATVMDTLQQVIHTDPIPPRQVNVTVPRDLETICLKCLQKDPSRRYCEARELAEDLGRFLANEPIQARPVTRMERTIKWIRRQPAVAGLIAASVIASMASVGLAVAVPLYMQTQEAYGEAERQRAGAERQKERAERYEYRFRIALAEDYWREGDLYEARDTLWGASSSPMRNWEWYYLHRLLFSQPDVQALPESRVLGRHEGPVCGLAYSQEMGGFASLDPDGMVRIWDVSGDHPPRTIGHSDQRFGCSAVSADGRFVAAAGADIRIWSNSTGVEVFRKRVTPATVHSIAISPGGTRLAVALDNSASMPGAVQVWDVGSGEKLISIPQTVQYVAFSPDGQLLAGAIAVTPSGNSPQPSNHHRNGRLPGLPGGFVRTPSGNKVKVWGTSDAIVRSELELEARPCALTFSPDAQHLVVGEGSTVTVWHTASGRWLMLLAGHSKDVRGLAFSPDQTRLASASDDGTIKIWDWESHRRTTPLPQQEGPRLDREGWASVAVLVQALMTLHCGSPGVSGPVTSLAYSHDGHQILSGSDDGIIRIFDGRPLPRRQP